MAEIDNSQELGALHEAKRLEFYKAVFELHSFFPEGAGRQELESAVKDYDGTDKEKLTFTVHIKDTGNDDFSIKRDFLAGRDLMKRPLREVLMTIEQHARR